MVRKRPHIKRPPEGKITLIFTDIEDSSRMTNALGNDVYLKEMREPHCERIRRAINAHNGYEVKTMGDSFMVAFGRVDDALACAVAIQKNISEHPITQADKEGRAWIVRVRIGVHTAEKELIPDNQGDYGGGDVNFAARVESLGAGEQIIVSEYSYRSANTCERYGWHEWADRRIKSFDEPETVWELLWDGTERGEPGLRWLPKWYLGEKNRYIPRPHLENAILKHFAKLRPDGSIPRLVTLHGYGGMGKTRAAIACALKSVSLFSDHIFFAPLADLPQSAEAVAQAIGAALDLTKEAALPDKILTFLRHKDLLLVLDNYESVKCPEAQGFLNALLTRTNTVRLLVTGRETVGIADGEQVVRLVQGMESDEAEQLFITRAQLKHPEWQPDSPEKSDLQLKSQEWQPDAQERIELQRILQLTECIPLAVELAAAWTDERSVKEIADGIAKTLLGEIMAEQPDEIHMDTTQRHRSLTLCLDWSFGLLEDWAQEGFVRLGVFAGADSFTAQTVAEICELPEAQRALDRLRKAALLNRTELNGQSRYTMLRPTRACAAEKLSGRSDAAELQRRFVAHYRRLAGENSDKNDLQKLAVLDAEWRNAIAATDTALALQDWESVWTISADLGDFLMMRGLWAERQRLNQWALDAARTAGDPKAEGAALNNLGIVYGPQGRWADAEACYQQCLQIKRAFGDREGERNALNNLGLVNQAQARWTDAEASLQESLQITRKFGDRVTEGLTLNNLGVVFRLQGRWAEAEACLQQSLQIAREFGDHQSERNTLHNLGLIHHDHGRWAEAEACLQQSCKIAREFGDRVTEGLQLNNLGNVYQLQGRRAEAEAFYQQSLQISREFGDRIGEGQTLNNLALLHEAQRNTKQALEYAGLALAVLEGTEDKYELNRARELVARLEQQELTAEESSKIRRPRTRTSGRRSC